MKIILKTFLIIFLLLNVSAADSTDIQVKLVFLTPDVADYYDHRGCTPSITKQLKEFYKTSYPDEYIDYDLKKLLENDVKPYYIFHSKYCKKIGEVLGANTFVMTRLVLQGHDEKGECVGDLYDMYIKVYSALTKREEIIFESEKVPAYEFENYFKGKEKEVIDKIRKLSLK